VLLPEQVDVLADHFNIDRRQLFERYLIVIWGKNLNKNEHFAKVSITTKEA